MIAQITIFFSYVLIFMSVFIIAAIGCMFSERSGVTSIGIEGMMIFGNLIGLLMLSYLNTTKLYSWLVVIIVILSTMIASMLFSFLLSLAIIKFQANSTLIGTAVNLIATAFAVFLIKFLSPYSTSTIQFKKDFFVLFSIGNLEINIFLILSIVILFLSYFILYRLRFGLRLMSCGENPRSASNANINVYKYRYIGVLISGALAGLSAIAYTLSVGSYWNSTNGIFGLGFLSIAIMIFGAWKPFGILLAALFFSFFMSFSYCYESFLDLFHIVIDAKKINIIKTFFEILPYVLTLIMLIIVSKRNYAPKAVGKPFKKKY